ncbi:MULTISPECIES: hypothetical protein [Mycobacteriaceae]|jgi:hypothetical protein|uniref:Uncharacterized protein n=1 Tax=Mycobacterium dioxanotrophicus TaxID=482462 RepID=A0A1Y0C444_9MYCO|nr:hypothetical protein [Mycobacterium dioxanotrophicus]ART69968.1 hypothetical protein BTO20_16545 [Mycobacterium dioxanotrophicus]
MILTSKSALAAVAVAGAIAGSAVGLGAATASADPAAPPPSLEAPASAPRKPAQTWQGQPVVWWDWGSGGHWGVWINDGFIPLT